jgi:1,2-diacylglycerol 3-alpha-glucosyltransferase
LITSDWYAPAVNGVVASVLNLRRELEARGHEVRVLTLSQSPRSSCQDGVTRLGSIGAGKIYPGARLRTALGSRYVHELLQWGPDIVHSQCEFSTFFLARKIAETLDVPLIHTYHTVYEDYTHYFSPIQKWGHQTVAALSRWITARTDCVIAPTEKVRRLLEGYGVRTPIRVIPSGIDLRKFAAPVPPERLTALKRELAIPEDHLVLACIGRLAEEKNISEVLRDFAQCRQDAPMTLLLVGGGPYREELEREAKALELGDSVIFTGMVPPQQVAEYYHLGDLFVSASTSETQGLTYIEALSSGLPALCRADDCLEGVVENGRNGWQFTTQEEFRDYLRQFAGSPTLREQLRRGAAESADGFSAQVFAQRVEQVYQEQLRLSSLRKDSREETA